MINYYNSGRQIFTICITLLRTQVSLNHYACKIVHLCISEFLASSSPSLIFVGFFFGGGAGLCGRKLVYSWTQRHTVGMREMEGPDLSAHCSLIVNCFKTVKKPEGGGGEVGGGVTFSCFHL